MLGGSRPNAEQVLAGLKDFQRATVEYVFRRLYEDRPHQRRFLVADEVGLGKTLVARGVIAKTVEHLWDAVPRIDVIYICSNADIARQNISRLRIPGASEFTLASRLTMLPVQVQDLKHSRLNFISLTPGTSFDPKSRLGKWQERALLYLLLREPWKLRGTGPLNLFQGDKGTSLFRAAVKDFEASHTVDEALAEEFRAALNRRSDLFDLCQDLVKRFAYSRRHIPREDAQRRRKLIGELRGCLAATCVEALEPDLVILDEFQRFKDLLDGEDDAATLARNLFEWSTGDERARVLLLSATPYKMYTQAHERETEDHYRDFLRTVRFLSPDGNAVGDFDVLLRDYRSQIYRLDDDGTDALSHIKTRLERRLRELMVRTERLAVTTDRDGMLREATRGGLDLREGDIRTYRALHDLAARVEHGDPVEFWKSAPYLLSFMEGYELKKRLTEKQTHAPSARGIADTLRRATGLSISQDDIEQYAELDPHNARLRWLLADTVDRGAWRMLWLPPSLPYYRAQGVWLDPQLEGFTKRLIFSSWRVVPRMIAALVSYAAERAAVTALTDRRFTWSNLRERLRGPLRFDLREGQPAGMTALTTIYPSVGLGVLADPLQGAADDRRLDEVRNEALGRIEDALRDLGPGREVGGEDERWYWAAPILLDLRHDEEAVRLFLEDDAAAAIWSGGAPEDEDRGWERHLALARQLLADGLVLGRQPRDLPTAMIDLALGAPGISAVRALARVAEPVTLAERVIARQQAAAIAWSVRNLFNLPESVALIRGINPAEPYWVRVIEYCVAGNLQAVLDEYAHLLVDSLGLRGQSERTIMSEIGEHLRGVLSLRTSNPGFDEVLVENGGFRVTSHRIRARFALRFGDERSESDDRQGMRADQVRQAFNSPFWPFVLATTSVGQEGLDFHSYCHAVVHWNLPSNPVDLEQREGRVHRYKGHAVRKSVASRYCSAIANASGGDPWESVFEAAASDSATDSDLTPFWVHGDPEGCRIERHVPLLPLSRDVIRFENLRRSLALYRMVFGQPRQEDLIAYLAERLPLKKAQQLLAASWIDLRPPELTASQRRPGARKTRARRRVEPKGEIGQAILAVLDRYPLVLGRNDASERHPVAQAIARLASAIETAGVVQAERVGWNVEYRNRRRWLPVPVVWLRDKRRRVRKVDDLTVELLLDPERDGVHVALALMLLRNGDTASFSLQTARRYRELRGEALHEIADPLDEDGFMPLPASEFIRVGDADTTQGVTLAARFFSRAELESDEPILFGLRRALAAYERAYERRLATPETLARKLLR